MLPGQTDPYGGILPPTYGGSGSYAAQQPAVAPLAPVAPSYANVGHDGNYNGMTREQWRDAWMRQGQLTPQAADSWLRSNGAQQVNAANGTWSTPFGETYDMQIGRKAALASGGTVTAGWLGVGAGSAPRTAQPGLPTAAANAPNAQQDELLNILMGRIKQGVTPDPNDPNIRRQADAFDAQGQRSRRQFLAEQAESQGPYAQGSLNNESRLSAERLGQASGGFEAQLIGQEIKARREEIQNALTLYSSHLTAQQKMALERELANLDASVKKMGISVQREGLAQDQRQFEDRQALDWGRFNWDMDPSNPNFY
jgi:hypothetical protein